MYKKIFVFFVICFLGVSLLPSAGQAGIFERYGLEMTGKKAGYNITDTAKTDIYKRAGAIIGGALSLIGIIFFGFMLYAGYRWMTAMGDDEKITKAKNTIEAAIIGLVLVLAAYAISSFIMGRLGIQGGGGEGDQIPGSASYACACGDGSCSDVSSNEECETICGQSEGMEAMVEGTCAEICPNGVCGNTPEPVDICCHYYSDSGANNLFKCRDTQGPANNQNEWINICGSMESAAQIVGTAGQCGIDQACIDMRNSISGSCTTINCSTYGLQRVCEAHEPYCVWTISCNNEEVNPPSNANCEQKDYTDCLLSHACDWR